MLESFATPGRPHSLAEVLAFANGSDELDARLREFLDAFYSESSASRRAAMLAIEPPLQDQSRVNSYLAAVAEHLARQYGLDIPEWTHAPERFLHQPFLASGLESLKATLLVESPVAFRKRMIFVDADPLYRPRRDTTGFHATANAHS